MQKLEPKILNLQDPPLIIEFEKSYLQSRIHDENEREFHSWHASWRQESLNHYLPLGWSFGLFDSATKKLVGYFIAQPQLFFRSMTQTLWVERLTGTSADVVAELIELAYRICREKHFQKALFCVHDDVELMHSVLQLGRVEDNLMELKTAKF
jgi:hypothetical protein